IREQHLKADQALLITALDEIAWILNIRGDEIPNNPVVISYLLLTAEQCFLFIDPNKLGREVKDYFKEQGVLCQGYKDIYTLTKKFAAKQLLYDPETTNIKLAQAIAEQVQTKAQSSPIALMKALRNPVEIKNVKQAMIKDGVAMVQFLIWLDQNKDKGITELDVSDKLYQLRSKQDLFQGESFDTIAGYGKHGAIVHYSATPASNATLKPEGFILVDSGAQYLDGTTDLTRTIALGELSEEEKLDYTLVLKGHIALARAKFPEGTRGSQLDILARLPLWEQKKNFLHGTGHGVGQFLCVHEGPQSIRMNENPITLQIGMLTSNEPGVYIDGSHGVRIENLMLVAPWSEGLFGNYYQFETVTLCPICTRGIIKSKLTAEEIDWLNNYHQQVYHKLSPHLTAEEQKWLAKATSKI
ncbi:MAG: aminopeptidase family protein P, partial [Bacteroides sp.]